MSFTPADQDDAEVLPAFFDALTNLENVFRARLEDPGRWTDEHLHQVNDLLIDFLTLRRRLHQLR